MTTKFSLLLRALDETWSGGGLLQEITETEYTYKNSRLASFYCPDKNKILLWDNLLYILQ